MDYYYQYQTVEDMVADTGEGSRHLWPDYLEERANYGHDDSEHVRAWKASEQYAKRPFRFEDLYGAPEPAHWGPKYPKSLGAAVEKWRKLEKKRELTKEEVRAYGRAVDKAIGALQRREFLGSATGYPPINCNVQNTTGTCNTAEGEERRYRHWVEVRLPAIRNERRAHENGIQAVSHALFVDREWLREAA